MSKTVAKAVVVLDALADGPRTASELGRELEVHTSTALRLVQPLLDARLVRRDADGLYRLGMRLAELGQGVLDELDLRSVARKHLVALSEATRATVHLSQLVDDRIAYVDKIESASPVRTWSRIGRAVPLHTSAASKVILAHLPPERRDDLLARHEFARHTDSTITDPAAFREHLEQVSAQGYATDQFEFEPLVHCVGVPVPDAAGRIEAALSVTTVRTAPDAAEVRRLVTRAREAVSGILAELGPAIGAGPAAGVGPANGAGPATGPATGIGPGIGAGLGTRAR